MRAHASVVRRQYGFTNSQKVACTQTTEAVVGKTTHAGTEIVTKAMTHRPYWVNGRGEDPSIFNLA